MKIYIIVVEVPVVCAVLQVPPTLIITSFDCFHVPPIFTFVDGVVVVVYPLLEEVKVPVDDDV